MDVGNFFKKTIIAFFFIFYVVLVISMIAGGASAAVMTITPDLEASKPCYLGYYAHCSFTPFSTLILIVLAGVGIILSIHACYKVWPKFLNYMKK